MSWPQCERYIFSFSRNVFRSETVHLLLRIILESFKLHYFFLTSITCDEYFVLRTQIRSDASSCQTIANLDTFYTRFPVTVNSFIVSANSAHVTRKQVQSRFKHECLAAKHLNFERTLVSQLSGVHGCRRKRQLSFLYNVFIQMQQRPQLAISVESESLSPANFHKPGPFCSSSSTLVGFFHVEVF